MKTYHAGVFVEDVVRGAASLAVPDLEAHPAENMEAAIALALDYATHLGLSVTGIWTKMHRPGDDTCCP